MKKTCLKLIILPLLFFDNNIAKADELNLIDVFVAKIQKPQNEPEYIEIETDNFANNKIANLKEFIDTICQKFGYKNDQFIFMSNGEIINLEKNNDFNKLMAISFDEFSKIEIFSGEDISDKSQTTFYVNLINNNDIGISPLLTQFSAKPAQFANRYNLNPDIISFSMLDEKINFSANTKIQNSDPKYTSSLNGNINANGNVKSQFDEEETSEKSIDIYGENSLKLDDLNLKLSLDNNLQYSTKKWGHIDQNDGISSKVQRGIFTREKQFHKIDLSGSKSFNGINASIAYSMDNKSFSDKISKIEIDNINIQKHYENTQFRQSFQKLNANFKSENHQFSTQAQIININNGGNFFGQEHKELPIFSNKNYYDLRELSLISSINNNFKLSKKLRLYSNIASVYFNFSQNGSFEKQEEDFYILPSFGLYYQLNGQTKISTQSTQKRGKFYYGEYGFNSQISHNKNQTEFLLIETTQINKITLDRKLDDNADLKLKFEHSQITDKIEDNQSKNGKLDFSVFEADLNWTLDDIANGLWLKSKLVYNRAYNSEFINQKIAQAHEDKKGSFELKLAQKIDDNNQWGAYLIHQSKYYNFNFDTIILYPEQSNWGFYFDFLVNNGAKISAEINNPFAQEYLFYKTKYSNDNSGEIINTINFSQDRSKPKLTLSFKKTL